MIIMLLITVSGVLAYQTSRVKVNGDSSPLQWTAYYPIPPPPPWAHYPVIDDYPPNDDYDYIYTTITKYQDWWRLTDWGGWIPQPDNSNIHIYSITIHERARTTSFSFPACSISLLHNMPDPEPVALQYVGTSYTDTSRTSTCFGTLFNCQPITIQNITDLQIGVQSSIPTGVRNTIRLTSAYLTVNWDYVVACNGTADCVIDCSVDPLVLDDVDVGGYNITLSGDGTVQFSADKSITNFDTMTITNGCKIKANDNNIIESN